MHTALFLAASLTLLGSATAQSPTLTLASKNTTGVAAAGESEDPFISPSGRYLLFESNAPDVTPDVIHNGGSENLYLYDGWTGTTKLLSRGPNGGTANGWTGTANNLAAMDMFSPDERFIALFSRSSDLTSDVDNNNSSDLFLYDLETDAISLVSRSINGGTGNGETNQDFTWSADARFLAFESRATDLTGDADNNGDYDLYLFDRIADTITLISKGLGGAAGDDTSEEAFITADGSEVLFVSRATDLTTDPTTVAFGTELFSWERQTETITRLSFSTSGDSTTGFVRIEDMSDDGQFVVCKSGAKDWTPETHVSSDQNLFLVDRPAGTVRLISRSINGPQTVAGESDHARITADGSFVVFECEGGDLTADADNNFNDGRYDIYLYDRESDSSELISKALNGGTGNGECKYPAITEDGRYVAFASRASDLTTTPDANGDYDTFLYDRSTGLMLHVSQFGGQSGDDECDDPRFSRYGRYMCLEVTASNLTGSVDSNNDEDVLYFDLLGPSAIGNPFCFADPVSADCPCGNPGGADEGCANSSGTGAKLLGSGSASLSADDLALTTSGLPANAIGLTFGGSTTAHFPFGDGRRCVAGALTRLSIEQASPAGVLVTNSAASKDFLAATAGDQRYYQCWYRDNTGPCGSGFNVSAALEVIYLP